MPAIPILAGTPWHAVHGGDACVISNEGEDMNALRMAAIALIVVGCLGLVYGSFSYTKNTQEAKLGPIELSVKEKQTVNVPVWGSIGVILIGGVLLIAGGRKN